MNERYSGKTSDSSEDTSDDTQYDKAMAFFNMMANGGKGEESDETSRPDNSSAEGGETDDSGAKDDNGLYRGPGTGGGNA